MYNDDDALDVLINVFFCVSASRNAFITDTLLPQFSGILICRAHCHAHPFVNLEAIPRCNKNNDEHATVVLMQAAHLEQHN